MRTRLKEAAGSVLGGAAAMLLLAFGAASTTSAQPGPIQLDPSHLITPSLLDEAMSSFQAHRDRISSRVRLAVVDLAQPSWKPRFFIVDLDTGSVTSIRVAHGAGSDPDGNGIISALDHPENGVSNVRGSKASSIGGYLVGSSYYSRKHRSTALRLVGLDSTNDNAATRFLLVHAAIRKDGQDYVSSSWIRRYGRAGRSEGCFAVALSDLPTILRTLPSGAFIYAGPHNTPTLTVRAPQLLAVQ